VAGVIGAFVLGAHSGVHRQRALELYDDAATARDQCPVR
jgi:hypothetical protein